MPPRHVVVDGSNIATEGRSLPSLEQLDTAVTEFLAENPDDVITVVVDASFAHRIDSSELPAFEEAETEGEVVSPPAGAIGRGDAFLLRIAQKTGATVLSNDSFQEFHGEHEWVFDEGRLIGGKPVPGVGWIFTPRSPVRGPKSREAVSQAKRKKQDEAKPATKTGTRTKKVEKAIATATTEVSSTEPKKRRRRGAEESPSEPINEPLGFITFIAQHRLGSEVVGSVEAFSSHGAYVEVETLRCYVPLSAMGDPVPRSAREVLKKGEDYSFVIQALDPQRRGVELALPDYAQISGSPTPETVEAEIKPDPESDEPVEDNDRDSPISVGQEVTKPRRNTRRSKPGSEDSQVLEAAVEAAEEGPKTRRRSPKKPVADGAEPEETAQLGTKAQPARNRASRSSTDAADPKPPTKARSTTRKAAAAGAAPAESTGGLAQPAAKRSRKAVGSLRVEPVQPEISGAQKPTAKKAVTAKSSASADNAGADPEPRKSTRSAKAATSSKAATKAVLPAVKAATPAAKASAPVKRARKASGGSTTTAGNAGKNTSSTETPATKAPASKRSAPASTARKSPAGKSPAGKAPAAKAPAAKAPAAKASAVKAPASQSGTVTTTAKKAAAKKAASKTAVVTKTATPRPATKKAAAEKSAVQKATTAKASTKKTAAAKVPARKSTASG